MLDFRDLRLYTLESSFFCNDFILFLIIIPYVKKNVLYSWMTLFLPEHQKMLIHLFVWSNDVGLHCLIFTISDQHLDLSCLFMFLANISNLLLCSLGCFCFSSFWSILNTFSQIYIFLLLVFMFCFLFNWSKYRTAIYFDLAYKGIVFPKPF